MVLNKILTFFLTVSKNIPENVPRRILCQHPTLHTGSSYVATGSRRISSRFLNFIRSNRYGCHELKIR